MGRGASRRAVGLLAALASATAAEQHAAVGPEARARTQAFAAPPPGSSPGPGPAPRVTDPVLSWRRVQFRGTRAGLGNRVEEIVGALVLANRTRKRVTYVWRNPRSEESRRWYPRLLSVDGSAVDVADRGARGRRVVGEVPGISQMSRAEAFAAGRAVRPAFRLAWDGPAPSVCLHVRGTDKFHTGRFANGTVDPYHTWTLGQVQALMDRAVSYVREQHPGATAFVASDTPALAADMTARLAGAGIAGLAKPRTDGHGPGGAALKVPGAYEDFFALATCPYVVQVARSSSFSRFAAIVGNGVFVRLIAPPPPPGAPGPGPGPGEPAGPFVEHAGRGNEALIATREGRPLPVPGTGSTDHHNPYGNDRAKRTKGASPERTWRQGPALALLLCPLAGLLALACWACRLDGRRRETRRRSEKAGELDGLKGVQACDSPGEDGDEARSQA